MPEAKVGTKTVEGTLADNNYPSSVDSFIRNDTPFEGSDSSLPSESPIMGSDGKLPTTRISKIK